jgi:large subunit ribosomal protein L25
MDRPVDTRVALVLTGEGERESDGGIVNLVMRELAISCLPNQIPESIVVDVSKLALGDTLLVKDLEIPEGITVNHDPEEVVVTVNAPRAAAEAAEPAEEAEEAAPEGAPEAAEQAADGEA